MRIFSGTLSLEAILDAGASTVRISVMILLIVVGARIFTTAMAFIKFPAELTGFVTTLDISPMLVWALIVILYLILGCFMDGISMMLLTLPVTFPILILGLGFDPIWFGVILTVLIEIALITPPIGIHLFVLQAMAGHKSIKTVVMGSTPFMLLMLLLVVVFSVYPQIITWLPQVYSGR